MRHSAAVVSGRRARQHGAAPSRPDPSSFAKSELDARDLERGKTIAVGLVLHQEIGDTNRCRERAQLVEAGRRELRPLRVERGHEGVVVGAEETDAECPTRRGTVDEQAHLQARVGSV